MQNEEERLPPGVIVPPDDIKRLADKTAENVARDILMEKAIKDKFADSPNFSFLNANDPLRPYFDWKV